jgi:DNA repair protein RadA/Sms
MAKVAATRFECAECGAASPKWLGRCASCGAWGTLGEMPVRASAVQAVATRTPVSLTEVRADSARRVLTTMAEFDRVLGGGAVAGGVTLLGGDPGIGKSTLLMQVLLAMARAGQRVLYVSGEESAAQVALRADRLGRADGVMLLATTEVEDVAAAIGAGGYAAAVIDSIQTLRARDLESAPGSVAQLREVTARLVDLAKERGVATFLVGHVTKDGSLAGPKVLEHLVDTVLSFEGEAGQSHRIVRARKNRFGPVSELAVFEMAQGGLREVTDPSALFVGERPEGAPGSVVVPTVEGSRPLLVEVQALVAPALYGAPRRVVSGLDANRLAVLLAVLQRKAGVHVLDQDVFASAAGGARVDEPAVDLALCAAVVSSLRERPLAPRTLCFGEVGLVGEVRAVPHAEARVSEARKFGFARAVIPRVNAERTGPSAGFEVVAVATLEQALGALF